MVCSIDFKYYEILQFNFCCFSSVTFGHYNSLINNRVFYYNICGFLAEWWFGYNIPIKWIKFIILSLKRIGTLEVKTLRCLTSKFWEFEFDLRPSEVNSGQNSSAVWKPILWFPIQLPLTLSISKCFSDVRHQSSIATFFLIRTVFEIFDSKVFRVWPSTFKGYLRSKVFPSFERQCMISYLTSIDISCLSHTLFVILTSKCFKFRPWPSTFRPGVNKIFIIQKPVPDFLSNLNGNFLSSYRFRCIWLQSF